MDTEFSLGGRKYVFMYNLLLDESQSSEGQLMTHSFSQILHSDLFFFLLIFFTSSHNIFHIVLCFLCQILLVIIRNVQRYINKVYKSNYEVRNVGFFLRVFKYFPCRETGTVLFSSVLVTSFDFTFFSMSTIASKLVTLQF